MNSGYIGADKRRVKAGVYGLAKHILERLDGKFLASEAAAPGSSSDYELQAGYGISSTPSLHLDASILDGADASNNPNDNASISAWGDKSGKENDFAAPGGFFATPAFKESWLN